MKKILVGFSSIATYLLLAPSTFAASLDACPSSDFIGLCKLQFQDVIGPAVNWVFVVATVIALGYLIYGGIKWVMSEGDKTNVESARNHIVASIIGLIIIFLSYFILNLVLQFFIKKNINDLTLPNLSCVKRTTGDTTICCTDTDKAGKTGTIIYDPKTGVASCDI